MAFRNHNPNIPATRYSGEPISRSTKLKVDSENVKQGDPKENNSNVVSSQDYGKNSPALFNKRATLFC
jgi:hypothetical protein